MPFYYFFQKTSAPEPAGWKWLETCVNHKEAAEKEHTYNTLAAEQGAPVVRRVHANTQEEAQTIIDKYGPK